MPAEAVLIPGDGTGPELTAAALRVLDAAGAEIRWSTIQVGQVSLDATGDPLPANALDRMLAAGRVLKGPLAGRLASNLPSVNVTLRRRLGLFAQLRWCRGFAGLPAAAPDLDLVVVRETTEDLYAGVELGAGAPETLRLLTEVADRIDPPISRDAAVALRPISYAASLRAAEVAFDHARRSHRRRVTAVHKQAALPLTDGLFMSAVREAAARHADIELDEIAVDHAAMLLVQQPDRFQVIISPNQYGDILGDLGAGLIGGLGVVAGLNVGNGIRMFEAAHGTAPRRAGRDQANPIAMILCGAHLVRDAGQDAIAARIETAVAAAVADQQVTYDLRPDRSPIGALGTAAAAQAVIDRLDRD
jgi:isocitrate dehydrogenase (NAD+)